MLIDAGMLTMIARMAPMVMTAKVIIPCSERPRLGEALLTQRLVDMGSPTLAHDELDTAE